MNQVRPGMRELERDHGAAGVAGHVGPRDPEPVEQRGGIGCVVFDSRRYRGVRAPGPPAPVVPDQPIAARQLGRRVIDATVPGGVAQATRDADTVFRDELPSLGAWEFGAEEAAAITQPVLSVLGADTGQLWVEVAALARSWFPQREELVVEHVGHLLQMQSAVPVARGIAEFLGRHPMLTAEAGGARLAGGRAAG